MPLNAATRARLAKLIDATITPQHAERVRRTDAALTADGRVRGEQITGTIALPAIPAMPAESIAVPGHDYDDLQALLDDLSATLAGLSGVYLPIASPTFTGTLTGPDASFTGNTTLGNGDTDTSILQGHDRHKSAAPSIAVGVALGTGGSVGATVTGSEQSGEVVLTAGTASLVTGLMATITFATARPNTQYAVKIQARGTTAGVNAVQVYATRLTTSTWTINCNVAPTSGGIYAYHYAIREWTN